jgi:hypothetical protein
MGIDLAKNAFVLHGVDGHRNVVLKMHVQREQKVQF